MLGIRWSHGKYQEHSRRTIANVRTQLGALIWWFISARKWFKGPKVNLEHLMHGRDDQAAEIAQQEGKVIDGKGDDQSSDEEVQGVPGELPKGYQVGDVKSEGL